MSALRSATARRKKKQLQSEVTPPCLSAALTIPHTYSPGQTSAMYVGGDTGRIKVIKKNKDLQALFSSVVQHLRLRDGIDNLSSIDVVRRKMFPAEKPYIKGTRFRWQRFVEKFPQLVMVPGENGNNGNNHIRLAAGASYFIACVRRLLGFMA